MRRTLTAATLAAALLTGCGSGGDSTSLSSDFGSVVRASVTKAQTTSSKIKLTVTTKANGKDVVVQANGAMAGSEDPKAVRGTITMDFGPLKATERIVGGKLYLQVTGQPGWYALDLTKIAGSSLGSTANPASAAQALLGADKSTKKVGTEKLRGVETTHYRGTIALDQAAVDKQEGLARTGLQKLVDAGVTSMPFDAWIDAEGRMRQMEQRTSLTLQGVTASVTTLVEFFDFGADVKVTAPPASEVKDGTELLKGLGG